MSSCDKISMAASVLLLLLSGVGHALCEKPADGGSPPCTENCDAWTLLQSNVGSKAHSASLEQGSPSYGAATPAARPAAPAAMVSFVAGDPAERKEWIKCKISGAGEEPNSYHISVETKEGTKEIRNIPKVALRKAAGTALQSYAAGQRAEVQTWVPCTVSSRGSAADTYDIVAPGRVESHRRGVHAMQLRKVRNPHWLHSGDPALPSNVPGQDGGVCNGPVACSKTLTNCVAKKAKMAANNCGGHCDVVFVGDSILERLTGWLCYSNNPKFQDSRQVFQELVAARHPKSFILAGSCDETSQTLYTLDNALPSMKAPTLYFVMIGTNNIPKGGSAHALRGIRAVVAKLRAAHPTAHMLLHALTPRADDGKQLRFQAHIDEVNKELAAFVAAEQASGEPIEFVDCTGALRPHAQRREDFDNIMLHPSPAGYRAWLTCVSPVIDRKLADVAAQGGASVAVDPA